MARDLFRVANAPPPSEPGSGDPICQSAGPTHERCGLQKQWTLEACDRTSCSGFWAWRCPSGRHGEIDDMLDAAAHGLSHHLRARELLVEGVHLCLRCGARDWEANRRWALDWKPGWAVAPAALQTLKFMCRGCGNALPVHESLLHALEEDERGVSVARPRRGDPPRSCPCGRSAMAWDTDWIGPECACCFRIIYYPVENPDQPMCRTCQPRPR